MTQRAWPTIIQGGMGVAVSSWQLARSVAQAGELGVVSGTALDGVLARRLNDGDPGGHCRRALAHFPSQAMAERVLKKYYRPEGRAPGAPYRPHPTLTVQPTPDALDLCLTGNFVEVWLAKEGHEGVVGINLLEKVQVATASALLGAMLAGVDYVLVGAGVPREIAPLLDAFAAGQPGSMSIEVVGSPEPHIQTIDPVALLGDDLPVLPRPRFLAIISLHVLAGYLNRDERIRPDGFVVEGPVAGGHSAPPRGKMVLDDQGQPIYSAKDDADLAKMAEMGVPFWVAGAAATPEAVAAAREAGAQGVQIGTLFAVSAESGLLPSIREELLRRAGDGTLVVKNDALASPTGFPFKVAQLPGTVADPEVYAARERICDLGYLRTPVQRADGRLTYRCASEPVDMYVKKGGTLEDTVGRKCLCNALMANVGLAQVRKDGVVEDTGVTLGQDLTAVRRLLELHPEGWSATEAVNWLLARA